MERRALIAIILSFGIYLGWQKLYVEPRMSANRAAISSAPAAPGVTTPAAVQATAAPTMKPAAKAAPRAPQTMKLTTSVGEFTVGDQGPAIRNGALKNFPSDLRTMTRSEGALELAFNDPALSYLTQVQGRLSGDLQRAEWIYEDERVRLTRLVTASDTKPELNVLLQATFKSQAPQFAYVFVQAVGDKNAADAQDQQAIVFTNGSIERNSLNDFSAPKEILTSASYVGAVDRYFTLALLPQAPTEPKALLQPLTAGGVRTSLVYPLNGSTISIPLRLYFGPKDLEILRAVDPKLDHTVDFGWFTVIAYPLLTLLKWLYAFVHNYGVAIILLTLLLKIVTFPLTYKSMKSMKDMAKLQPQLAKIREKYKDDKEALNREMLSLMRTHGYNPAAGCIPLLIQMPIFFALYRVLYGSIELYKAPFAFWIQDLSLKDPYYITPVLLTLTMFLQQRLTPNTATDPMQQKMIQFMPLMFGIFMISLPSGLAIYMFVNALASIVQQVVLNRKFDVSRGPTVVSRA